MTLENIPLYTCLRCGYKWYPRFKVDVGPEKPRTCPKCHSPWWDRPRRTK